MGLAAAAARGAGVDEACRVAIVVGNVVRDTKRVGCCCWSLAGRAQVEEKAVAHGASIAGGKRFANALAGHSALLVSMLPGVV